MKTEVIRILLVEEVLEDVQLLEHCLWQVHDLQFQLSHVGKLENMEDLLETDGFDVVLLDLNLPDSQGLATLERAIALLPGMPIVVLTSEDDEKSGAQAVSCGAQDYLIKGEFDGWILRRTMGNAIERNRIRRNA